MIEKWQDDDFGGSGIVLFLVVGNYCTTVFIVIIHRSSYLRFVHLSACMLYIDKKN